MWTPFESSYTHSRRVPVGPPFEARNGVMKYLSSRLAILARWCSSFLVPPPVLARTSSSELKMTDVVISSA